LEQALAGQGDLFLGGRPVPLPAAFATYVRGPGKALREEPLEPYVSSIEATLSTDPSMNEATRVLRELRRSISPAAGALPNPNEFGGKLGQIRDAVSRRSSDDAYSADAATRLGNLEGLGSRLPLKSEEETAGWRAEVERELDELEADLRELRRRSTAAARATS
jgi:hypothetical protein